MMMTSRRKQSEKRRTADRRSAFVPSVCVARARPHASAQTSGGAGAAPTFTLPEGYANPQQGYSLLRPTWTSVHTTTGRRSCTLWSCAPDEEPCSQPHKEACLVEEAACKASEMNQD